MRRVKIFAGRCAVCCQIITEGHVTFGDKSIHTKCMKVSMDQASSGGNNIYHILKHHSFIADPPMQNFGWCVPLKLRKNIFGVLKTLCCQCQVCGEQVVDKYLTYKDLPICEKHFRQVGHVCSVCDEVTCHVSLPRVTCVWCSVSWTACAWWTAWSCARRTTRSWWPPGPASAAARRYPQVTRHWHL